MWTAASETICDERQARQEPVLLMLRGIEQGAIVSVIDSGRNGKRAVVEFFHRALWNAEHNRVEMHLCSRSRQTVRIAESQLEFTIEDGESIWTESSYKFTPTSLAALLTKNGFDIGEQWMDDADAFALTLAVAS